MLLSLFRDFSLNVEGLLLLLLFNQQNEQSYKNLKTNCQDDLPGKNGEGGGCRNGAKYEKGTTMLSTCLSVNDLQQNSNRTIFISSPVTEFNIADKVPTLSSQQLCEKGKLNWVMTGPRSTSERLEPGSCHAWSKSNTLTTTPHWSRVF